MAAHSVEFLKKNPHTLNPKGGSDQRALPSPTALPPPVFPHAFIKRVSLERVSEQSTIEALEAQKKDSYYHQFDQNDRNRYLSYVKTLLPTSPKEVDAVSINSQKKNYRFYFKVLELPNNILSIKSKEARSNLIKTHFRARAKLCHYDKNNQCLAKDDNDVFVLVKEARDSLLEWNQNYIVPKPEPKKPNYRDVSAFKGDGLKNNTVHVSRESPFEWDIRSNVEWSDLRPRTSDSSVGSVQVDEPLKNPKEAPSDRPYKKWPDRPNKTFPFKNSSFSSQEHSTSKQDRGVNRTYTSMPVGQKEFSCESLKNTFKSCVKNYFEDRDKRKISINDIKNALKQEWGAACIEDFAFIIFDLIVAHESEKEALINQALNKEILRGYCTVYKRSSNELLRSLILTCKNYGDARLKKACNHLLSFTYLQHHIVRGFINCFTGHFSARPSEPLSSFNKAYKA